MEFKVQKSWLSILIFNLVFAFLICVSIPFTYNICVFLVVFAICLCLLILYNTSIIFAFCSVDKNQITYKTGIFKYVIDLKSIKKIEKNTSYGPSLATSSTRVRIVTEEKGKQKVYYVSVVDRDKFIEVVNSKADLTKTKEEKNKNNTSKRKTTAKKKTKKSTTKKK